MDVSFEAMPTNCVLVENALKKYAYMLSCRCFFVHQTFSGPHQKKITST